MSWSREEALTDPAIANPMKLLSEFRFSLRDIPTEIVVRLFKPMHSGKIVIQRSHNIAVDGAGAAAAESFDEDCSEGEALREAVNHLVNVYNAARAKGLKPDASWLKPNPDFR